MKKYNVLILGGGGREHALIKAIKNSLILDKLYVTKTNSIFEKEAECISLDPMDNLAIKVFAHTHHIDLIIPGSEVYLNNKIADVIENENTIVFGPCSQAAQIETSKSFAKDLMHKYNIPTATSKTFSKYDDAEKYVKEQGAPIVIKYDGLAGGKGVVVAMELDIAISALKLMLKDRIYGNGNVVIEEFLEGEEFSYICMVNNRLYAPLPVSKDYKRLLDNDLGPNTGGMGAVSPVDFVTEDVVNNVNKTIIEPVLEALEKEKIPYKGFLYAGLILTKDGPKVIEFNARLGDPETEVILARLKTDFLTSVISLSNNNEVTLTQDNNYHLGVVLASNGYPSKYQKGVEIKGITDSESILHMGVKKLDDRYYTDGGRVLFVKGKGNTLQAAKENAYERVKEIHCDNLIYRKDIGKGA